MLRGGVGAVVMRGIMMRRIITILRVITMLRVITILRVITMLRVITTIRNTIMTMLEVIGVIMIPHESLTMQTLPIRRWKSCSGSCVS